MQPLEYVMVMLCGVLHLGATAAAYGYTSSPVERTSTSPAPRACGECDMRRCPPVNNCPGRLAKDDCNCCFTCYKPPDATTKAKTACNDVQCPRNKVCLLNIQNIPVCRCPSAFHCRNKRDKGVCGRNGISYKSRCHLKIAECNSGKKIRTAHRGHCVKANGLLGHRNSKLSKLSNHNHKLRLDGSHKHKRLRAEKRRRRQRNTRLLH